MNYIFYWSLSETLFAPDNICLNRFVHLQVCAKIICLCDISSFVSDTFTYFIIYNLGSIVSGNKILKVSSHFAVYCLVYFVLESRPIMI